MVDDEREEGEEEGKGDEEGGGRRRTAEASTSETSTSTNTTVAAVSLAASPEDEAAVYLEAGPLGAEAGRRLGVVAGAAVLVAAGSGGVIKDDPSLVHAPLARAAPLTARLLPRGKFEVYHGLGHLGPFESPGFVGERAAEAFARAAVTEEDRGESENWGSLPPEREFELELGSSSSISAKL